MKIIKLYNKTFTKLAAFTEKDFTALSHRRTLGEIGDASFTLRLNNPKVTEANLQLYNRIKIVEDGVVKFTGIITQKVVKLDTTDVKCRELPYILKKRLTADEYTLSGSVNDVAAQLLEDINGDEDTGIIAGTFDGTGTVNLTFNSADAWTVLKQICDATGNQFEIKDRTLSIAPIIGEDKSENVIFRYNVHQVASANLFSFEIEDDGEDIVTVAHGKSDTLTSDQTDSGLVGTFGTLETFKDFRVVNTQEVLDDFTSSEISDRIYSPKITLKSSVEDNFETGDIVKIKLRNSLVNINDSFQVLEKRVRYNGIQKLIEVRINDLPNYLVQKLADRDRRLELLEKQVV